MIDSVTVQVGPKPKEAISGRRPAYVSFHGSFAKRLRPRIWEDGDALKPRYSQVINSLSPNGGGYGESQFVWAAGASNADDADYWYSSTTAHHERAWAANCEITD